MVAIPCPSCRASSEQASPDETHWSCPACRRSYFLRRCSACTMVSHVGALQGWHQRWFCVWCQAANGGFSQHRDPAAATVAELAADVAGYGLRFGPAEPDRVTQPFPQLPIGRRHATAEPQPPPQPLTQPWPWPRPWRPGGRAAVLLVVVLAAAAMAVGIGRLGHGDLPDSAAMAGSSPGRRAVAVTATAVRTVDLRGVPGQLTIVGTSGGRVRLTGELRWSGRTAPAAARRLDTTDGALRLSFRCAAASPCTEDYRLAVPGHTAIVLRQPSGHIVVSGVAGALRIQATSADVSATGLRSPALAAQITSGHLSASFDVPPRQVSVALTSAQATVRLPPGAGYRVFSQVSSGFVHVGVPRAAGPAPIVTARVDQGELQLLPT